MKLALLVCLLGAAAAEARPLVTVDTPRAGSTVSSGFVIGGWTLDFSSPSGTGVSAIHVWAFPASGNAVFLGAVPGSFFNRPDVGAAFGTRFTRSGFNISTAGLAPGQYQVVLYPFSTITGAFDPGGATVLPLSVGGGPASSATLKVLDWNTQHGTDTAGVCSADRIVTWIVTSGANVVSLNEVEKNSGWCNNEDQPARYLSLLRARTGKAWYSNFAQRDGQATGQGNLILTTFPIEASEDYTLSYSRSVARAQILVNGIRVNIFSTHLDADSSARRAAQMAQLKNWADNYPEQRILAGDYNAWPGAAEIGNMTSGHLDAWAVAKANGTAVAYAGNEAGNTRNSRIDYVFYSRGASRLVLKQSRVFDIREPSGVMPSDHRPVMATFEVR